MMIVKTKNSTYEIEGDEIRCLSTKRTDYDDVVITSEWKKFHTRFGTHVGASLRIFWDKWGQSATTTSIILEIEDDEPELSWTK